MAVAFRGANQVFGTTTSTNITVPAATQAGDTIVLQVAGGWTPSVPAGWTTEYAYAGTNIGSFVAYKTAVAGDAGSVVTVKWNNTYNHVLNMIVLSGVVGLRLPGSHLWSSSGGTGTPDYQGTAAGDVVVYVGGNRECGGAPTLSRGTVVVSGSDSSSIMAGVIGYEAIDVDTDRLTCTFTSPKSGKGYEYTTLVASGGGTVLTNAMVSRQSIEVLASDSVVNAQISRQSIEVLIPTAPRFRGWGIGG